MLWHFAYSLAWPRNARIFAYKPHIPTPPHTHAHTYTYISSRSIAAINRPSFIIFNENRQRCQLQPQPITTTESNTHKWIVLVFVVYYHTQVHIPTHFILRCLEIFIINRRGFSSLSAFIIKTSRSLAHSLSLDLISAALSQLSRA